MVDLERSFKPFRIFSFCFLNAIEELIDARFICMHFNEMLVSVNRILICLAFVQRESVIRNWQRERLQNGTESNNNSIWSQFDITGIDVAV